MAESKQRIQPAPRVSLRRQRGRRSEIGGFAVTPEALVLTVRLPFADFVWQRPTAVAVEQGGRIARLPIRDVTRLAQCALIGAGAVFGLVFRRRATRSKEGQS
jgi:hypothetical protein